MVSSSDNDVCAITTLSDPNYALHLAAPNPFGDNKIKNLALVQVIFILMARVSVVFHRYAFVSKLI